MNFMSLHSLYAYGDKSKNKSASKERLHNEAKGYIHSLGCKSLRTTESTETWRRKEVDLFEKQSGYYYKLIRVVS